MTGILDADDMLAKLDEDHWNALVASGEYTQKEVDKARRKLAVREEVSMCKAMLLMGLKAKDELVLRIASLQLELEKRYLAIETLSQYHAQHAHVNTQVSLLLAKLYFRDDKKNKASVLCQELVDLYKEANTPDTELTEDAAHTLASPSDPDGYRQQRAKDKQAVADAFYILGWIAIHAGDHTQAYTVWEDGYTWLPNDKRLRKQHRKRYCWDQERVQGEADGKGQDGCANAPVDEMEAFSVDEAHQAELALNLFSRRTQKNRVVFRSKKPIIPEDERQMVLDACEQFAADNGGGWGTVRHCSVPTTDVAVEDIPILRPWLRTLMRKCLAPMLRACFPLLADGTDLGPRGDRVRIHDAFVVRYDAADRSVSLPTHSDTSSLSFTVALTEQSGYEGGGTWFGALGGKVVDAPAGHAVAFAGPLRHAGHPISHGTRTILVLFCYIEGFRYGKYVGFDGEDDLEHEHAHSETSESVHAFNGVRESGGESETKRLNGLGMDGGVDKTGRCCDGVLSVSGVHGDVCRGVGGVKVDASGGQMVGRKKKQCGDDDKYDVGKGYIVYNETYELMTTIDAK
ncbi:hypothetical protein SARC_06289 [Sphaeroforma arctica JP610]|uniref:Fe2OG dioxygenase domain-containing protein n=1 Tax=Sphaeroforma arctica JP610 TaxID=667725 RepID=A0A0L0FXL0_9EUKA|nr:hypothetical protein SARC_06289 [Sphaeroforma arctica JP610]KNC81384.1 hypothetical protein SARC_06289 [Sphaeroforma arctica JP610]|eukprot:XP_014155286.1 hypothetical protein SARC_06289 [Sphaeroforma arctica JP610]